MSAAAPSAPPTPRPPAVARSTSAPPPEVGGALPLLGHALPFGRDPLGFLRRCHAAHGDIFTIRLPGSRRTFLMNPLDYPEYFRHPSLAFYDVGAEIGGRAFGYTRADSDAADPHTISQQVGTFMKGEPLQAMSERMQGLLEQRLFALPAGEWQRDQLFHWANELIFAAGTDAIFGDGVYGPGLKQAYTTIDQKFGWLAMGVPASLLRGVRAAQATLAAHMLRPGLHHAALLDARVAHFRAHHVPDEVWSRFDSGIMWAAQANTVPAAFWTLFYVLRDPRAKAEILEEVRGIVGDAPPPAPGVRPFTREELRRMEKLESAITEMNRLTTAPMVPRRVVEDCDFPLRDGRTVRLTEGMDLALFPPVVQLDPDIYPDPLTFQFDRFLPENGRKKKFFKNGERVHFHMLPFGGGESMCPGRFFAINEFKIAVATLLLWFDIELESHEAPGFRLERTGFGTYPPTFDVPFRYRRR